MSALEPPPGWTVVRERRQVATEDAASAFTDGHQWTVRDPDGQRPPQAEWPTAWYRQAVLYAHMMAARDPDAEPPPYAPSPTAMDMLPRQQREHRYVAPEDWTGRAEHRPGLMWRRWQIEEDLAGDVPAPPSYPDRILAHWAVHDPAELVAVCSPAKLALGVTLDFPTGQVGPGWRWWARLGFGIRGADGAITQSVALKFHHRERDRRALFYWTRPVPDPRLILAAIVPPGRTGAHSYDGMAPLWWPSLAAVLGQLPDPTWTSELTTAWTDDMPRKVASADVKREIRS